MTDTTQSELVGSISPHFSYPNASLRNSHMSYMPCFKAMGTLWLRAGNRELPH